MGQGDLFDDGWDQYHSTRRGPIGDRQSLGQAMARPNYPDGEGHPGLSLSFG